MWHSGERTEPNSSNAVDQDIITTQQIQQCTENSTQIKGDDPLSHILDNIPVLSGNGSVGS